MTNSVLSSAEAVILEVARQLADPQEELSSLTEEMKEAIFNGAIDALDYERVVGWFDEDAVALSTPE